MLTKRRTKRNSKVRLEILIYILFWLITVLNFWIIEAAIDANAPLHDEQEQNTGPIDSDEEKDAVMAGIARAFSQPVIRPAKVHTLRKYQYIRMKEMLSTAIAGNGGRSLFAVGEAAARRSMSIAEGEVPSRSVQQ